MTKQLMAKTGSRSSSADLKYAERNNFYDGSSTGAGVTGRRVARAYETKKVLCRASSSCEIKFEIDVKELSLQRKISKINKNK